MNVPPFSKFLPDVVRDEESSVGTSKTRSPSRVFARWRQGIDSRDRNKLGNWGWDDIIRNILGIRRFCKEKELSDPCQNKQRG
jgi:hypothetical protein